ncbi:MAG: hypothetical protein COT16_00245 [Elusimicrobia bacterium CG08_land_8_20_14_0_20_44_26]|nr:MAG: hypothetical protein COT16_00245 [Elusimicrobia bacterium CG08_land_8_20_14_0_20_44_26]
MGEKSRDFRFDNVKGGDIGYYLHRTLVFLTPIFCFMAAVFFYLKTYDSATIKITVVQVGGFFLIGIFFVRMLERGLKFSKEEIIFLLPVAAYFLWGCFSYAKSPFKMWASFEEFWRRCVYTGLIFIGFLEFRKVRDVKYFTFILLLTGFVVCAYGVMQKFGIDPFAWKGAFGGRQFSTFGNPNFFGAWLVGVSAFPLCYFLKTKNPLYIGLYFLTAYNVYISITKGSFIGFMTATATAFILIVIFAGFINRRKALKYLKIGLPLAIICLLYLVYRAGNPISYRFRIFTWMSAMEMAKKHPLAGTGIGSFKETYPMFRHPEIFYIEGKHNTETDHAHCEYFEVFYEDGIIGFGIYLLIMFITFYSATGKLGKMARVPDYSKNPEIIDRTFLIIGWVAGAVGMFVQAGVDVHMRFVSSGHIFWLMIGVIGALTFPEKEKKDFVIKINDLTKIILEFAVIIVTVFFMLFFRRFFIADVNHNIAIAYSKQGVWDRALFHYDRVLTLWPRFIMAHYFMGNVYNDRWNVTAQYNPLWDKGLPVGTQRTDPQRTIAKYDDVLRLAPNYVQVHYQEGNIYLKMGQFEKAIEKFNKAIDIDPIFPLSPFRKGYCLVRLGRYAEAEAAFREAIAKDKKESGREFVEAYTNLANVLYLGKKYAEAEKYYIRVIEITQKLESFMSLLSFYRNTNQTAAAKVLCQKILEVDPKNQEVREILRKL